MISAPERRATSCFFGSPAGTSPLPNSARPRNSTAVAMVLAVNCPPHAPAPGQARSSISHRPASDSLPDACAPTASNTSMMVTSRPPTRPGAIDPP